MSRDEATIEAAIQASGATAPRLTPELIDATIQAELYHHFPGTTLIVCALVLKNGFTVVGESAAASPENFRRDIGERVAREKAREKIWALEGYLLRERLHNGAELQPLTDVTLPQRRDYAKDPSAGRAKRIQQYEQLIQGNLHQNASYQQCIDEELDMMEKGL